jgi:hypothetical protein
MQRFIPRDACFCPKGLCLTVDTSQPHMYNTVRFCLSSENRWGSCMLKLVGPQLPRPQALALLTKTRRCTAK